MGVPTDEFADDESITDVNTYEWIAWAPMLALILFLGLYPRPLFTTTDDAVVNSLHECLYEEGEAGEACFDRLREDAEAAGN
jgi:NADH:ubiquinone oxidoreductase subunit 4 (subunit M)